MNRLYHKVLVFLIVMIGIQACQKNIVFVSEEDFDYIFSNKVLLDRAVDFSHKETINVGFAVFSGDGQLVSNFRNTETVFADILMADGSKVTVKELLAVTPGEFYEQLYTFIRIVQNGRTKIGFNLEKHLFVKAKNLFGDANHIVSFEGVNVTGFAFMGSQHQSSMFLWKPDKSRCVILEISTKEAGINIEEVSWSIVSSFSWLNQKERANELQSTSGEQKGKRVLIPSAQSNQ